VKLNSEMSVYMYDKTTFLDWILLARSSSCDRSGVAGRSKRQLWH
jgi:hypothetical protein